MQVSRMSKRDCTVALQRAIHRAYGNVPDIQDEMRTLPLGTLRDIAKASHRIADVECRASYIVIALVKTTQEDTHNGTAR